MVLREKKTKAWFFYLAYQYRNKDKWFGIRNNENQIVNICQLPIQ